MAKYSIKLLMVCICLLCVAGLNGIATAGENVKDLIAGAVAYIDKYESGKIAYTLEYESAPYDMADEHIEERLRYFFGKYERLSDKQISERRNKERASEIKRMSKKNRNSSGKCEVVFEGDSQYVTNNFFDGQFFERYDYNGYSTMITEFVRIPDSTKTPIFIRRAEVSNHKCTNASLYSILDKYRSLRALLVYPKRKWVLFDKKEENGEVVYLLADTTSQGVFKHFLKIVPEKGYYIKEYWYYKVGHEPVWTGKRFNNPTWNQDAQIYYPGKLVNESVTRFNPGQVYYPGYPPAKESAFGIKIPHEMLERITLTQTDVNFNIDVPDETFHVPMKKYNEIIEDHLAEDDNDSNWRRHYTSPDEVRRFLKKINGLSAKEPARSKAIQKPSDVIDAKPLTEQEFTAEALKILNTHYPDSFIGITVKNKSRMELRMKEGGKNLDTEALEQIAGTAVRTLQEAFDTSNCVVVISLGNGKVLAIGRYHGGKFLTRVY